jgi:hypothetical protein
MATQNLEQRLKRLEGINEKQQRKLEEQQLKIERMEAAREIENMMSRYEYYHVNNRHKEVMAMYSKDAGTRVYFGELGYWKGANAPQRAWGLLDQMPPQPGTMHFHPTMCPVIEVAADGKTAQALWTTFGFESGVKKDTGELDPQYAWGTYGADLIKEDGQWKFWHFHIYRLLMHPVNKPWTTKEGWDPDKEGGMELPDDKKPDAPGVDDSPYRTDKVNVIKPDPPLPYKKWGDTKMA